MYDLNNLPYCSIVCLEKLCVLLRFAFIKNVISFRLCHFVSLKKSKVRDSMNYNCM